MGVLYQKIKNYLDSLDSDPKLKIGEFEVAKQIKNIASATDEKATGEALHEIIAFDLFPSRAEGGNSWGTYYGPQMTFKQEEGEGVVEYPGRQYVSADAIAYWEKRAREAKHPILIERYSDLVVDFSLMVLSKRAKYDLAQKVIDSVISICEDDLVEDTYQQHKLRRALDLAIIWNDQDRLSRIKEAVIKCEKKIATDDKPGLWGFAFKWLVLEGAEKTAVTESELNWMLQDLESRLERLSSSDNPDPWPVECGVNLLVEYYAKAGDAQNVERLLLILEDAFRKNKRSNSDGLLRVNYLEKLQALYQQYQGFGAIRDHMSRIMRELPEASKESLKSIKEISTSVTITNADLEKFIDGIFTNKESETTKSIEEVVIRLAQEFYVNKKRMSKQLDDTSKVAVFRFIVQQSRMSPDGHTIGVIRPLDEDYEGHLVDQAFQHVQISAIFLSRAMARFKIEFAAEGAYNQLALSELFPPQDKEYLMGGLEAYWRADYLKASLAFIPYIEQLFRRLVANSGGIVLKPNKVGGYDYRSLNDIVKDPSVDQVFGEEASFYFKVILTHPFGWNLRNNFAHGIGIESFSRQDIADRLFHILLLLSLVRAGGSPKNS